MTLKLELVLLDASYALARLPPGRTNVDWKQGEFVAAIASPREPHLSAKPVPCRKAQSPNPAFAVSEWLARSRSTPWASSRPPYSRLPRQGLVFSPTRPGRRITYSSNKQISNSLCRA
jgi:hypothetical protein